jgi:RHS repeat-associated protein
MVSTLEPFKLSPRQVNPLRSRYMDPKVARFTEMDSFAGQLGIPITLHKYLYAGADPIDNVDPSGRFFGAFIGGLVGFLLGFGISMKLRQMDATSKLGIYGWFLRVGLSQLQRTAWKFWFTMLFTFLGALVENKFTIPQVNVKTRKGKNQWFTNVTGEDLIAVVQRVVDGDDKITSFTYTGHGAPDVLELKDEWFLSAQGGKIIVGLGEEGTDVTNLFQRAFAPNAFIDIQGCNVTSGDDNIAKSLSEILPGRTVRGTFWWDIYFGFDFTLNPIKRTYLNGNLQ